MFGKCEESGHNFWQGIRFLIHTELTPSYTKKNENYICAFTIKSFLLIERNTIKTQYFFKEVKWNID